MTDPARYAVNEYAPDPSVVFDRKIGETYVRDAHMLAARGYVQSTLGGMVIRVEHPKRPDGIAYAKPAGDHLRVRGEAPDPRRAPVRAAKGTKPEAMSEDEMRWMFEHGDDIVYPALVRKDATRPRGRKASRIRAR